MAEQNTNERVRKLKLKEVKLALRIIFAVVFFILGFNISKSAFFEGLAFFGYHTIVEVLISAGAALFGYYLLPKLLLQAKYWIENLIVKTVTDIVSDFWDLQSKRIQDARREKQKKKSEEEKKKREKELEDALVIDTSVLIDGRVLDIIKTGFIDQTLVIPQCVLDELQYISDNKDKMKRQRGRRGLDIVKALKKETDVLIPKIKSDSKETDKRLYEFAKKHKLRLVTLDFNLNKVAKVSGVRVLNINELINAVKTLMLPGEELVIKIIQPGKERKQGIGYLDDGTMVVVEDTKERVNQEVRAKVSKVIQSSAGRIIFCDLVKKSK